MTDVSTLRINLLRACYLLLVVGLALNFWPLVLSGAAARPLMDGVVNALLSAMGLLAVLGVLSPLRMLPLLLFEITWKLIWALSVALPHWLAGTIDPGIAATIFACAWVIPFVFIIPWRYAFRTYARHMERWR